MMRNKRFMLTIAVLLAVSTLLILSPKPKTKTLPNLWPILRVIDGNTVVIRYHDQPERIRLLRVNTPEKGQYGYRQAKKAMKNLVDGCKVFIEFEGVGEGKRDRYGCLLAYIFHDGCNINIEMVRLGWCRFWTKYGQGKYADEFREAEREARKAGRGLWKSK